MKGNDTVHGMDGDDVVRGNAGNDVVHADRGDDTAFGGSGDDHVFGEIGNDVLSGGGGFDTLEGGNGNDTLIGSGGTDTLIGGKGADMFVFSSNDADGSNDTIQDYNPLQGDTINLAALDSTSDPLNLVGELTGVQGQIALHVDPLANASVILFDRDGDGAADLTIDVPGVINPLDLVI